MVTNLFTNPDMVATSGEVVVWENHYPHPLVDESMPGTVVGGGATRTWVDTEEFPYARVAKTGTVGSPYLTLPQFAVEGTARLTVQVDFRSSELQQEAFFRLQAVDSSGGAVGARVESAPTSSPEWATQTVVWEPPAGSRGTLLTVLGSNRPEGSSFDVRNVRVSSVAIPFFDETFSPDPDLTPQPRPGGGSQLVGQQVAGLSASGGVVVQSTQWSKSRGVSGRIINNTGDPVTVTIDDASVFTRLWTYDGAKETLATLTSPSVIPGPDTLGESKWVDLITSTAQRYDGPPFSGSTPNSADDSGYGWVYEWLGAPDASPSTREYTQVNDTAVMVVEDLDAPAVGITVEGLSSTEASRIAIYRQTPGKERTLVQGLGDVDVDGAGYWVDYLPPLGVPVTYVVEVLEGDPLEENSATITIPSKTAWLQDALNPLLAVEVAFTSTREGIYFTTGAFQELDRAVHGQTITPMGASVPVGMGSRRQVPQAIPFNMITRAAEASSLLREVLMESTHLVLRVPPVISMLDPVMYLSSVQVLEEVVQNTYLGGHMIRWNLSGSQTRGPRIMAWTALWTYDDVAELYAGYTYTDLTDGRRYVDWMAKPDEAQLAGFSTTSSGGSNA